MGALTEPESFIIESRRGDTCSLTCHRLEENFHRPGHSIFFFSVGPLAGIECCFSLANRNFQGARMIGHIRQSERQRASLLARKTFHDWSLARPTKLARKNICTEKYESGADGRGEGEIGEDDSRGNVRRRKEHIPQVKRKTKGLKKEK